MSESLINDRRTLSKLCLCNDCVRLQFFDIWYNSIKNKWEFYIVSSIEIYKLQTKELF